uniref:Zinc-finger domain-containing protein n=1 Tax=Compsopogon caeruleus TaxID=31354 RepID=A0A7S1XFA8_9RHOD|mmetsp:Transcript_8046/g.16199  ORF Transcript_8046/g.16199 Transcript_8046/m.16199 type:complete len:237 (+) Transcript_8046:154-864(+)
MAGADENDTIGTEVTTLKSLDSTEWAEIEDTLKRAAEEQRKEWIRLYCSQSEQVHSSFTSEISHGEASESWMGMQLPSHNAVGREQPGTVNWSGLMRRDTLTTDETRIEIEDHESTMSGNTFTLEPPRSSSKPVAVIWKPRTFTHAKPSSYCHTCGGKKRLIHCSNVNSGSCRKSICSSCFGRYGLEHPVPDANWTCTHCRGCCPPQARCISYQRAVDQRRQRNMALKKMSNQSEN